MAIDTIYIKNQQGEEDPVPIGAKAENVIYNAAATGTIPADSVHNQIKTLNEHKESTVTNVNSQVGVHGLRYQDSKLQVKDSNNQQVDAGGGGDMQSSVYAPGGQGIISINHGGTGNSDGYIRTGTTQTAGARATAEGHSTVAKGENSHAEGNSTSAIGKAAHAEGGYSTSIATIQQGTYAAGNNSHAEGLKTSAIENNSHAEGWKTCAVGSQAHAEGEITTAYGENSHAEGLSNYSIGDRSHTEGNGTTALTINCHAEGFGTYAVGLQAHAEGEETTAYGDNSHAEGSSTTAYGESSHAEGSGTYAKGKYSHTEGETTTAQNDTCHAEGQNTYSSGIGSHAEGNETKVLGNQSHAEGYGTTAKGLSCHSEGSETYSAGNHAHSEGYKTMAQGNDSHAGGNSTTAYGENSHAEGWYTYAQDYQHVQGHYNSQLTGGTVDSTSGTAFIIGNGTENNLSNAFTVKYDGSVNYLSAGNTPNADYAEFFEQNDSNEENEDRVGYFVTFEEDKKIKLASAEDDYILGITSAAPSLVGNSDCDTQNGMMVRDEFNRVQYEPAQKYEFNEETKKLEPVVDEQGNPVYEGTKPVINPEYDPSQEYISRWDRPEWAPVGMLGVLPVRDDGTCEVNGYCTVAEGGIATKATDESVNKYRVIGRKTENVIEVVFR